MELTSITVDMPHIVNMQNTDTNNTDHHDNNITMINSETSNNSIIHIDTNNNKDTDDIVTDVSFIAQHAIHIQSDIMVLKQDNNNNNNIEHNYITDLDTNTKTYMNSNSNAMYTGFSKDNNTDMDINVNRRHTVWNTPMVSESRLGQHIPPLTVLGNILYTA